MTQILTNPSIKAIAETYTTSESSLPSNIVPLRPEGSDLPVFLVHETTGEMIYGPELTHQLHEGMPVFGLTSYAIDGAPLRTLQAMATRAIRAIRLVQPHGPYRLAGWSFGGNLAYEIATQLIGEDQEVAFLGLIDTFHRAAKSRANFPSEDDLVKAYWSPDSEKAQKFDELSTLEKMALELRSLPSELGLSKFKQYASRQIAHMKAERDYDPQPINIPIHLFSAQGHGKKDQTNGWGAIVQKDQLRVISVPGDHDSILTPPHITSLGKALSKAIQQQEKSTDDLQVKQPHSRLVTIQQGQQDLAPLFCVPGAGESVVSFTELVKALGQKWPVYGLQPRGLDGQAIPYTTVQAAAHAFVEVVQDVYPHGLIHLHGHSYGGWVAFEMALRLQEAGRDVGSLTILDSRAPMQADDPRTRPEYTRLEALMKLIEVLEQKAEDSLEIALEDLKELSPQEQLHLLHKKLVQVGLLSLKSEADILKGPIRTYETALRDDYRPNSICPHNTKLILVDDPKLDQQDNERKMMETKEGWQHWMPAMRHLHGPGNHMTALLTPHVQHVADWILADLDPAPSAVSSPSIKERRISTPSTRLRETNNNLERETNNDLE